MSELRPEVPDGLAAAVAKMMARDPAARFQTPLEAFDMLIAAHAISVGAVLVTSDRDFYNVRPALALADWTLPM